MTGISVFLKKDFKMRQNEKNEMKLEVINNDSDKNQHLIC